MKTSASNKGTNAVWNTSQTMRLIAEVEVHPCIWDIRNPDFSNKGKKDDAWEHICQNLFDNWFKLQTTQKSTIRRDLKKKWHNTRDYYKNYLSSLSTRKKFIRERKYALSDSLKFLIPILLPEGLPEEVQTILERSENVIHEMVQDDSFIIIEAHPKTSDYYVEVNELSNQTIQQEVVATDMNTTENELDMSLRNEVIEEDKGENDECVLIYSVRSSVERELTERAESKCDFIKLKDDNNESSNERSCSTCHNTLFEKKSDELFLASIANDMKMMNPVQKLEFKSGMVTLVRKYKNP